jgi:hypothetical protein
MLSDPPARAPILPSMLTGVEATSVAADPPRDGWLALWSGEGAVSGADDQLELVLPAGSRVRRRTIPVRRVPLAGAMKSSIGPSDDRTRPARRGHAWPGGR